MRDRYGQARAEAKERVKAERRRRKREDGRPTAGDGSEQQALNKVAKITRDATSPRSKPIVLASSGSTTASSTIIPSSPAASDYVRGLHRASEGMNYRSSGSRLGGSSPVLHASARTDRTDTTIDRQMGGMKVKQPSPCPLRLSPANIPLSARRQPTASQESKDYDFDAGLDDNFWQHATQYET
jgi:hypothetical protein